MSVGHIATLWGVLFVSWMAANLLGSRLLEWLGNVDAADSSAAGISTFLLRCAVVVGAGSLWMHWAERGHLVGVSVSSVGWLALGMLGLAAVFAAYAVWKSSAGQE